jgi:hypothetical protein
VKHGFPKENTTEAIGYYEKAVQINVRALGDQHPNLAPIYNSLGGAWFPKGEHDKAIGVL